MEHTLPDIILFPIPFVCLFAYLKEVESYITMFKKHPKLLTGIIIGCLVILVVVIVCNANWVITNCTDAIISEQSDINAFEGINALFAGLAFIGILYTLHQQNKSLNNSNKQLKFSMIQQEKSTIIQAISNIHKSLSDLNSLYNSRNTNRTTNANELHLSNYIDMHFCIIFKNFITTYPTATSEQAKSKLFFETARQYKQIAQTFIEIAAPLRILYDMIDSSHLLSKEDKESLGKMAFSIFNHTDTKVLDVMYLEVLFRETYGNAAVFNSHFSYETAKYTIRAINPNTNEELIHLFMHVIANAQAIFDNHIRQTGAS